QASICEPERHGALRALGLTVLRISNRDLRSTRELVSIARTNSAITKLRAKIRSAASRAESQRSGLETEPGDLAGRHRLLKLLEIPVRFQRGQRCLVGSNASSERRAQLRHERRVAPRCPQRPDRGGPI